MHTDPQKEHQWLRKFLGDWTIEMDCGDNNGQPSTSTGSESVRMMGDLWIVFEGQCVMPDGKPGTTMMTLGFDPAKKRFVGTWQGSMMANLWVYEGELDAAGTTLTLNTEGPNMAAPGTTAKYKDVLEFKTDSHRVLRSHMQGEDGKWQQFMTAHFRRK